MAIVLENMAIVLENFLWNAIQRFGWFFLIATLQLFQNPENVKFQFFPLHCPGRNAISSKVFNEFTKTFFWLKDEEDGYCGWKFLVHRDFGFAIATLQLSKLEKMWKFQFFPLNCPGRNAISSKVFNEFTKTFSSLKDKKCGYCGWKSLVHRDFGFAIATLQLSKLEKM